MAKKQYSKRHMIILGSVMIALWSITSSVVTYFLGWGVIPAGITGALTASIAFPIAQLAENVFKNPHIK